MPAYAVNVRAIVRATPLDDDAPALIPGWEIYDYEAPEEDGETATLRCDQLVRVEAAGPEEAVEAAKDAADAIQMKGWEVGDVDLWVDAGIDIDPEYASEGPKP